MTDLGAAQQADDSTSIRDVGGTEGRAKAATLRETAVLNGVRCRWGRSGTSSATPLVLVHGFSGSSHDFAGVIGDLARDFEVYRFDFRGHGESEKLGNSAGYSLASLAEDLIEFLETVVQGPAHVLGHSMGGRASTLAALQREDLVASLILADTTIWSFAAADPDLRDLIADFMSSYDPASGLPQEKAIETPESAMIERVTTADWRQRKEVLAAGFDPHAFAALGRELIAADGHPGEGVSGLTMPVTVVVGSEDEPYASHAQDVVALVPDARLAVIDSAYHSPQLTHPRQWLSAVRDHIERATLGSMGPA